MSSHHYAEIVVHRSRDNPAGFVESCVSGLLEEVIQRFGTFGKADCYLSRDTLYGLKAKLGTQNRIEAKTLFLLAKTAGYDGVLVRQCALEDCVCSDTH